MPKYEVTVSWCDGSDREEYDDAFAAGARVGELRREGFRGVAVTRDGVRVAARQLPVYAWREMPPPLD